MLYGYRHDNRGYPRTYCRCVGLDNMEYIIRRDALVSGATKHITGAGYKNVKKDLLNQRFGLLIVLYDTGIRNNNGNVIWHCLCDCGNECDVSSTNLISGHTMSCGCRHKSKWEMFIKDYLRDNNIQFIEEYRFADCRNKKQTDTLPFDFYLFNQNKIIEYDGLHHFQPINGWGGEEKFRTTVENDNIKNEYCKTHNIKILRLPYTLSKEEIISQINSFINS